MRPSGAYSLDDEPEALGDSATLVSDDADRASFAQSDVRLGWGGVAPDLGLVDGERRLDLVEARLSRIENRMMELSTLIARHFNVSMQTPLAAPEAASAPTASDLGSRGDYTQAAARPQPVAAVPARPRPRRDRESDEALEAFLDSLSAQARQRS